MKSRMEVGRSVWGGGNKTNRNIMHKGKCQIGFQRKIKRKVDSKEPERTWRTFFFFLKEVKTQGTKILVEAREYIEAETWGWVNMQKSPRKQFH